MSASDPTTPQVLRARSIATSLAYNGFYFATYHQGAGFADATLIANDSEALGGAFLNATANVTTDQYYLDFNTTISAGAGVPPIYYAAQIESEGGYNSMSLLTVNLAAPPVGGFTFDSEGRLAFQNGTDWAACEWVHAVNSPLFDRADFSLDIRACTGDLLSMKVLRLCLVDVLRLNWSERISFRKINLLCLSGYAL